MLEHSHLSGPRRKRVSKIVEGEIYDPSVPASAYKPLLHVIDSRSGFDTREDIFSCCSVFA